MKFFLSIVKSIAFTLLLASSAYAADKVNINTADAKALSEVLIGVGATKAEAIIEYRKTNGPFKSAEELAMVKGIGLKTVEKNRERIELRTPAAPGKRAAAGSANADAKPAPVTRR